MGKSRGPKRWMVLLLTVCLLSASVGLAEAPILSPGEGQELPADDGAALERVAAAEWPLPIERVEIVDSVSGEACAFITAGVPVDIRYTLAVPAELAGTALTFSLNQPARGEASAGNTRIYTGVVFPAGATTVVFSACAELPDGSRYTGRYTHTVAANEPAPSEPAPSIRSWSLSEVTGGPGGWTTIADGVSTVRYGHTVCLRMEFEASIDDETRLRILNGQGYSIAISSGLLYQDLAVDTNALSLYLKSDDITGGTVTVQAADSARYRFTFPGGAYLIDPAEIGEWAEDVFSLSGARVYDKTTAVSADRAYPGTYLCAATGETVTLLPQFETTTPDAGRNKQLRVASALASIDGQKTVRFALRTGGDLSFESQYRIDPRPVAVSVDPPYEKLFGHAEPDYDRALVAAVSGNAQSGPIQGDAPHFTLSLPRSGGGDAQERVGTYDLALNTPVSACGNYIAVEADLTDALVIAPLSIVLGDQPITNRTAALNFSCPEIETITTVQPPILTAAWTDAATGESGMVLVSADRAEGVVELPVFAESADGAEWMRALSPGSTVELSLVSDGVACALWPNGEESLTLTVSRAQGLPLEIDPTLDYGPVGSDGKYPPLTLTGAASAGEPLGISVGGTEISRAVADGEGLWRAQIDLDALFERGLCAKGDAIEFTIGYLDVESAAMGHIVRPAKASEQTDTEEESSETEVDGSETPPILGPAINARFGVISGVVEPETEVLVEIDGDGETITADETGFFSRVSKPLKEGQTYRVSYQDSGKNQHDLTITAPKLYKGDTVTAHSLGLMMPSTDGRYYPVTPLYDSLRADDGTWEFTLALGNTLALGTVRIAPDEIEPLMRLNWALKDEYRTIQETGALISPYEEEPTPEQLADRPVAETMFSDQTTHLYLDVYLDAFTLMEAMDRCDLNDCRADYRAMLEIYLELIAERAQADAP